MSEDQAVVSVEIELSPISFNTDDLVTDSVSATLQMWTDWLRRSFLILEKINENTEVLEIDVQDDVTYVTLFEDDAEWLVDHFVWADFEEGDDEDEGSA